MRILVQILIQIHKSVYTDEASYFHVDTDQDSSFSSP